MNEGTEETWLNELHDVRRQRSESNRISNLLVKEIKTAYTDPDPAELEDQPSTKLLK